MGLGNVSRAAGSNRDHAILGDHEDVAHALPFGAVDVTVAVAVELLKAILDWAVGQLVLFNDAVLVGVMFFEGLAEGWDDDDVARVGAGAPASQVESVVRANCRRHIADAGQAADSP